MFQPESPASDMPRLCCRHLMCFLFLQNLFTSVLRFLPRFSSFFTRKGGGGGRVAQSPHHHGIGRGAHGEGAAAL